MRLMTDIAALMKKKDLNSLYKPAKFEIQSITLTQENDWKARGHCLFTKADMRRKKKKE